MANFLRRKGILSRCSVVLSIQKNYKVASKENQVKIFIVEQMQKAAFIMKQKPNSPQAIGVISVVKGTLSRDFYTEEQQPLCQVGINLCGHKQKILV